MKKFYITTPIFYPNAKLHMGHAYTTVLADSLARYKKLLGEEVYLLTGSDENTEKVVRAAKDADKKTELYLDEVVENFKDLYAKLGINYDQFVRTSDQKVHWPGAQELWKKLDAAGDLEKRSYEGLYCIGHESFITEKELVDGKCPEHGEVPQQLKEENYFFKLSKYTSKIKEKIQNGELEIIPETRKNEILALLDRGLEDVSFSRPKDKVSVGIPVPGDDTQVMYVWCDALSNYLTALGYGTSNTELLDKFWPADLHVIGKDILRFHAAIWPGMLLSAGIELPKKILVHGFIKSEGRKMSKTLGNVIDPLELIQEYGAEAVRYYLLRHISTFEDGEMTKESFKDAYNAGLANGLGNLASRILALSQKYLEKCPDIPEKSDFTQYFKFYENCDINRAVDLIWHEIGNLDKYIQETEPFKVIKTDEKKGKEIISTMVLRLYAIARMLSPIMPETNILLKKLIKENITPEKPLFPRKD